MYEYRCCEVFEVASGLGSWGLPRTGGIAGLDQGLVERYGVVDEVWLSWPSKYGFVNIPLDILTVQHVLELCLSNSLATPPIAHIFRFPLVVCGIVSGNTNDIQTLSQSSRFKKESPQYGQRQATTLASGTARLSSPSFVSVCPMSPMLASAPALPLSPAPSAPLP